MNFMPVEISGGTAKLPFAEVELSDETRQAVDGHSGTNLMAGIRPEHFEDASLIGDQAGPKFEVKIELLESMGSELYAYFDIEAGGASSEQLDELAADTGAEVGSSDADTTQVVARLDAASKAAQGRADRALARPGADPHLRPRLGRADQRIASRRRSMISSSHSWVRSSR